MGITVIVFFDGSDLANIKSALKELNLESDKSIVLIDARSDNKTSASKV